MDADDDFGCLGIPTPAEMWKQHAELLDVEIECLRRENQRARRNIAKLVEMHRQVSSERDGLQRALSETTARLSRANLECANLGNEARGLGNIKAKADAYFEKLQSTERALFGLKNKIAAKLIPGFDGDL